MRIISMRDNRPGHNRDPGLHRHRTHRHPLTRTTQIGHRIPPQPVIARSQIRLILPQLRPRRLRYQLRPLRPQCIHTLIPTHLLLLCRMLHSHLHPQTKLFPLRPIHLQVTSGLRDQNRLQEDGASREDGECRLGLMMTVRMV